MTPVVKVDVLRPGDVGAVHRLFASCSTETVVGRFFAPLRAVPASYLASALAGPPRRHDALVLRYGDGLHLAGLASLVRGPVGGDAAELAVLIGDGFQGAGLGRLVVGQLLDRAADRGVEEVVASVLPRRAGLLRALARRLPLLSLEAGADCLTGRFRLGEEA